MPAGKKYRSRRSKPRKVATNVKRYVKRVAGAMIENKYHDVDVTVETAITNAGTQWELCNIADGTTNETRNGNIINPKSLELRCVFRNGTTQTRGEQIRLLLVANLNQNDPVPSIFNVLEGSGTSPVIQQYNYNNFGKQFRVLMDRVVDCIPNNDDSINYRTFRKYKLPKITYVGTGLNANAKGRLTLMAVSNSSGAIDTENPNLSFTSRMVYKDA